MELTKQAFTDDPNLDTVKGIVHSSGEGQWTVETALRLGVPTPVIALALFSRYSTQQENSFSAKVLARLRNLFGGHQVEVAE